VNPWQYVGGYGVSADADDGLVYMRARYQDPLRGVFVSRDPIGLRGGLNLYWYVDNNPVNMMDPLGLWGIPGLRGKGPDWHKKRNDFQTCPEKEVECQNNQDKWTPGVREVSHGGRMCYRGKGDKWRYQCCYRNDGKGEDDYELQGTYDYSPPVGRQPIPYWEPGIRWSVS